MTKLNEKFSEKRTIANILLFILTILVLSVSVGGCATVKKYDRIGNISFSPNNKKIIFDRYRDDRPAMIHVYDLETEKLSAYQPPQGEGWYTARYSFDGKQIVYSIIPKDAENNKQDSMNSQIALMDPAGINIKKITSTSGLKVKPSFSHDNKKVIFTKADTMGKSRPVGYDVYEVDLKSGIETRLTWFRFGEMSSPFYLPNDKKFIFSVFNLPFMYPGVAENDMETIRRKRSELELKFRNMGEVSIIGDNIYICKKGQKELPEPFIKLSSEYAYRNPQITVNGLIYFSVNAQIIMKYSPDGNHQRLNKPLLIRSYAISSDDTLLALVVNTPEFEWEKHKIVIYRVSDSTMSKEIILPDAPVPIINQQ